MDDEKIRLREEVQEQIRALKELKEMAASYGDDISKPAGNSREAVQVRCVGCAARMFCQIVLPVGVAGCCRTWCSRMPFIIVPELV
jgi:hypothetical protein